MHAPSQGRKVLSQHKQCACSSEATIRPGQALPSPTKADLTALDDEHAAGEEDKDELADHDAVEHKLKHEAAGLVGALVEVHLAVAPDKPAREEVGLRAH